MADLICTPANLVHSPIAEFKIKLEHTASLIHPSRAAVGLSVRSGTTKGEDGDRRQDHTVH
jgi:hypothetical protein